MPLLRLEGLTRAFGSLVALEASSVTLEPGAIGLLGPNGAGKSTLLKILLGLLEPTSGRAEVFGLDVRRSSAAIRARVGYMSETESFVPGIPAVELVALAGEVSGMPGKDAHRRAHEVLGYLGVEESRYRKVEELSTGVKQRVQLAQALVHDPELLILDEPTNGLDPGGRQAMLALIQSLHRDFKKSIILSSHLLNDVSRVCDAIIVLDRGKVLAHGRIDELRAHLRGRYRLRLAGQPDRFLSQLAAEGLAIRESSAERGEERELTVEVPPGFATRRFFELLAALEAGEAAAGGSAPVLRGLVPDEEKLDDLFRRIVDRHHEVRLGA
jgi:ABC-2 type transport system ATP-binding protein